MKTIGFFFLLAGWLLVLTALMLLPEGPARVAFVLAGMGVEATGLGFAVRTHMTPPDRKRDR